MLVQQVLSWGSMGGHTCNGEEGSHTKEVIKRAIGLVHGSYPLE